MNERWIKQGWNADGMTSRSLDCWINALVSATTSWIRGRAIPQSVHAFYSGSTASKLTSVPSLLHPFATLVIHLSDLLTDFYHALGNSGQLRSMFTSQSILLQHDVDLLADAWKRWKDGENSVRQNYKKWREREPSNILAFLLASFFSTLVKPASLRSVSP